MKNLGFPLTGASVLIGMAMMHALGQAGAPKRDPWLEPYTPTRLEWLALQKQAMEGHKDFAENGVTVNFYTGPDSLRTGEILCDLEYLPTAQAQVVQMIEDGILKRFEMSRQVYPWARVKIIKKVAQVN
jgi:hypothetical protein